MTKWISIFLILSYLPANASPVIMANPSDPIGYMAYIKSTNQSSWIDYTHDLYFSDKEAVELTRLFEQAQLAYFSQSPQTARPLYQKVIEFRNHPMVSPIAQEVITLSMLQLAGLEEDHHRSHFWIQAAFSYNPDFEPEKTNVPGKIASTWNHLKKNTTRQKIFLPNGYNNYSHLRINHTVMLVPKTKDYVLWPVTGTRQEIHFLSNSYKGQSWTFIVGEKDQHNKRPLNLPEPLIIGSCSTYSITEGLSVPPKYTLYFDPDCQVEIPQISNHSGLNQNSVTTKNNSSSLFAPEDHYVALSKKNPDTSLNTQWPENSTPVYKNKWFWIGVSTIAALVIYENNKPKDKETETVVVVPRSERK